MKKNLINKKKKKGFTLIELIIVIAIIAILAAIAIPKFGEVRTNANIKSDIANAKTIQSAAVALLGESKIEYGDADGTTIELGDSEGDAQEIATYLQNNPKTKLVKDGVFTITIDDKGNVEVGIREESGDTDPVTIYPEPTDSNKWYPAE